MIGSILIHCPDGIRAYFSVGYLIYEAQSCFWIYHYTVGVSASNPAIRKTEKRLMGRGYVHALDILHVYKFDVIFL